MYLSGLFWVPVVWIKNPSVFLSFTFLLLILPLFAIITFGSCKSAFISATNYLISAIQYLSCVWFMYSFVTGSISLVCSMVNVSLRRSVIRISGPICWFNSLGQRYSNCHDNSYADLFLLVVTNKTYYQKFDHCVIYTEHWNFIDTIITNLETLETRIGFFDSDDRKFRTSELAMILDFVLWNWLALTTP